MTRMILLLELGDWAGGHHGQSPYLVEFDSERLDSPFDVSEGWGHGLGGSSYSLARFVETEHYAQPQRSPLIVLLVAHKQVCSNCMRLSILLHYIR